MNYDWRISKYKTIAQDNTEFLTCEVHIYECRRCEAKSVKKEFSTWPNKIINEDDWDGDCNEILVKAE